MLFKNNKKIIAICLTVLFFIILDRVLKQAALENPTLKISLLGEILKFNYKNNDYIAFSLPLSGAWLSAVIFLIILLLIFYWLKAIMSGRRETALCLLAVIAGAAGNLFDRLAYGYVIDYLDLKYFTVLNLADMMVAAGVIGLMFAKSNKSENNFS